jgi:uncharacterized protein YecE (DUF72 family)
LLLGTCGWSYQEWVGRFYPNNKVAKLPFYAKVFDTVEVDSSFYRMPSKSMVKGWAKATGPFFKFSLKLPKMITHERALIDAEDELAKFLDVIKPLEDFGKLGCLLVQLAPSFAYDQADSLESFLSILPEHMHFAVEFRHYSWDRKEALDLLKKYKVANTITESPIEFLSKLAVTTPTHSYVRWHGRGKKIWYDYTYSEQELESWLPKLKELEEKVGMLYAYFNNHYRADAPYNTLQLLRMRKELTEPQQKVLKRIERKSMKQEPAKITDYFSRP